MYLIVSGTGRIGRAVARKLLSEGKSVRVLVRQPERAEDLRRLGAEVVQGDLTDTASLSRACKGAERVLATAHAMTGRGANSSRKVDLLGNRALIDAARAANVQHYVFISAMGAAPEHAVPFFRYKYATERYLRESKLSYTVLRPTAFMETWGQMVGKPAMTKGRAIILGQGTNPINVVSEIDVVAAALQALDDPTLRNRRIDLGGPENLTLNELATRYGRAAGRQVKLYHIPRIILQIVGIALLPFHSGMSQVLRTAVNMDQSKQRIEPTELRKILPRPLTSLDDVIRAGMAQQRADSIRA
ncbi:MAG: SDR family oxidoreductase [Oscillochloris sp.]|nr:SDR family oxidoreductase [Oscillochloris sp.]